MDQGYEWHPGAFADDKGVEPLEHCRDIVVLLGQDAQRMPGQAGYSGRFGTFAADIADGEPPTPPGNLEHVIEVAANLIPLARCLAPAVAIAGLAITVATESTAKAQQASTGMVLGSIAMAVSCVLAAVAIPRLQSRWGSLAAWAGWLAIGLGLYWAVFIGAQ